MEPPPPQGPGLTRGSSLGQVAGPERGRHFSATPKLTPSCSPPRNCPPGSPLQPLPLEPWCPRSTEWWRMGAAEGRGVSRKTRHSSEWAQAKSLCYPWVLPPTPTAIPTPQGTVNSQDSAGRGLEVPGEPEGAKMVVPRLLLLPGMPSPPPQSMYLGLPEFTPETWVSDPRSCHRDPA